jgi:glc operon protein GlcG
MKQFLSILLIAASLGFAATLAAPAGPQEPASVARKPVLTLDLARRVMEAAMAECRRLQAPGGAIAIVDDGGHVLCVERLDGTFAAAAHVSVGKARTSAMFRKPTRVFEEVIRAGRTSMVALEGFTPLQGGVPLEIDGAVVGAIGVSGAASAQQDDDIASAAAASLTMPAMASMGMMGGGSTVTYVPADAVRAAFARGAPLVETGEYKVHASRRTSGGQAEVHHDETDIFHVLEGSATLVTGGMVIGGTEIAPGEVRGSAIEGGESRTIRAGDVIIIPRGVPHWFKDVQGTCVYYVVKVL